MAIISEILTLKANLCIRLFLFTATLFISYPVAAFEQEQDEVEIAFRQLLDFQLDSCRLTIEKSSLSPQLFYLEVLLASTRIFIEDNPEVFNSKKNIESKLLERLSEANFSDAYTNFLKSEIKLQWAILKLKNNEEFSSFWNLRQAYTIAKENTIEHPEFLPSYKTLGFLHVLYGVFPEKYNWILSIFRIEGNVSLGLSELSKVYASSNFLSLESGMAIALMQTYLLNDPVSGARMMKEIYQEKKQLLIDYAFALILMKDAQSEEALEIIARSEYKYLQPFAIPQLYYAKGEVLLQKGQLDSAINQYNLFLKNHDGKNLIKDAYYKIGICYLIKGMPDKAESYFNNSLSNGWAKNETDKNAKIAIESSYRSTKELYQLRYATDGGFYENAFKIHSSIDTTKLSDQQRCEFYYRSARLYDKTNELEEAILNYQKTIKLQKSKEWYYAPNSSLHLGLIFVSKNNDTEAKKYLNLIDNYDGFPYQNSIRQKAKSLQKQLD